MVKLIYDLKRVGKITFDPLHLVEYSEQDGSEIAEHRLVPKQRKQPAWKKNHTTISITIMYAFTHIIWARFPDHLVLNVSSGVCIMLVHSILVRERKDMHTAVFKELSLLKVHVVA